MASKRALTGGTKDVNPQFLRGSLSQVTANVFAEVQIPIPVLRTNIGNNKAQVIEILGVHWEISRSPGLIDAVTFEIQLTTASQSIIIGLGDPDVFFRYGHSIDFITGGSEVLTKLVGYTPLNDGAGHGIIVASPSIFLGLDTANVATLESASVAVMYRFKNIGLTEFIGLTIAQSS